MVCQRHLRRFVREAVPVVIGTVVDASDHFLQEGHRADSFRELHVNACH